MKNLSSKKIAFYGVASALMFVFLLIETYLFTALLGSFTPAILTLPFAVALSIFLGKRGMFVGGTIFGCCSFFLAVIIANPVFINPLISILPRVFIGVIGCLVYLLFKRLFVSSKSAFVREILPCSIGGAFGILTNTVFTIFMMWTFSATGLEQIFATIMSLNFTAEIIGAIILVPVYTKAFNKIHKSF